METPRQGTSDLTIIYLTAGRMPKRWVDFHRKHLLAAIDGFPLVTVSPSSDDLGLGGTHLVQDIPYGGWSTFVLWNRAAKVAKTEFIAIAEDDSLYHPWHFTDYFKDFDPKPDEVVYDMSRWTVMSWHKDPCYSLIRRLGGFMMIAPRKLVIDALDEREEKYPNGFDRPGEIGRRDAEVRMGVSSHKHVEWWCRNASVNLAHTEGVSPTYIGHPSLKRKKGELKAYDIPHWGKAKDIAEVFNKGVLEEA